MKPFDISRLLAIAPLLCLALLLSACGQSSGAPSAAIPPTPTTLTIPTIRPTPGTPPTPTAATTPTTPTTPTTTQTSSNDALSNAELLKTASINMIALKSYHLEFRNEIVEGEFVPDPDITHMGQLGPFVWPATMTLDLRNTSDPPPNTDKMILKYETPGHGVLSKIVPGPRLEIETRRYESTDDGQSWFTPGGVSGGIIAKGYIVDYWEVPIDSEGYDEGKFRTIDLSPLLGDDRQDTEDIEGVPTRHMFVDVTDMRDARSLFGWLAHRGANRLDFWVSMDATPTVRQMRAEGRAYATSEKAGIVSFEATWNWTRFNEDFGEVKPPPTETVKSP
jgi:hypothetical protein